MSGMELSVGFDDSDDVYVMDNSVDDVDTRVAANATDPRRRLEERLEEMRLKRELRELDLDFRI
ncbi:hypothetical protein QWY82_13690 [Simiduia curdlanivorans]|uniref:PA3496 family putative envelope integrity protein n=1 Tax=Simiduia curdlanivorans TaxID=1492769 RepID=A0ABV8V9T7_9GAMM|nr:hypothetical protein [Simiduia curdlanivorans]MDN3639853.1 hypothetical protein [Simiduia curdlanivorans]